jgi:hypothetical protein
LKVRESQQKRAIRERSNAILQELRRALQRARYRAQQNMQVIFSQNCCAKKCYLTPRVSRAKWRAVIQL